ncbi:hypothetical protein GWK47_039306 [Chionoecetes opilio]|uniref:Uncharacterized protein n=1 Tax=Chionoecetes opilio TaxID=41210 RepID=A0A8J4YM25_CHIOP|nr:hypothetical protein GWK47_039306 [Chionoecetes opilio]
MQTIRPLSMLPPGGRQQKVFNSLKRRSCTRGSGGQETDGGCAGEPDTVTGLPHQCQATGAMEEAAEGKAMAQASGGGVSLVSRGHLLESEDEFEDLDYDSIHDDRIFDDGEDDGDEVEERDGEGEITRNARKMEKLLATGKIRIVTVGHKASPPPAKRTGNIIVHPVKRMRTEGGGGTAGDPMCSELRRINEVAKERNNILQNFTQQLLRRNEVHHRENMQLITHQHETLREQNELTHMLLQSMIHMHTHKED